LHEAIENGFCVWLFTGNFPVKGMRRPDGIGAPVYFPINLMFLKNLRF